METLSHQKQIGDIYRPKEFEVYLHQARFEPTIEKMVEIDQGLQPKCMIPPGESKCSCRRIKQKSILSPHDDLKPKTRVSTRSSPTKSTNCTIRYPKCPTCTTNLGRSDEASPRHG
jgi:hypothetical protein